MNSHRLFTILLSFLLAIPAATAYGHDIPIEFQPESRPPEGSLTEIMQDMLLTSLSPVITGAIHDYYEDERLQWAPYDVRLLQAKRLKGYRSFDFRFIIEIKPYIGAHHAVGIDRLTLRIRPAGARVESFRHIESFPYPPQFP